MVLFTDMLLVLKARRPTMPSRVFHFQSSRIDWFSDLEYTARKVRVHCSAIVGYMYVSVSLSYMYLQAGLICQKHSVRVLILAQ